MRGNNVIRVRAHNRVGKKKLVDLPQISLNLHEKMFKLFEDFDVQEVLSAVEYNMTLATNRRRGRRWFVFNEATKKIRAAVRELL